MIKIIKTLLKGKFGEIKTNITNLSFDSNFVSINDVMIMKNNNKTTQIDHIIFDTNNSIINVVETKNYNSKISGFIDEKYWEASYMNGIKIFDFYNPLLQNYGHIKSIQTLIKNKLDINIPLDNFRSIIYFNGNTELNVKNDLGNNENHLFSNRNLICSKKEYKNIIKIPNMFYTTPKKIDKNEMDKIINIVNEHNIIKKFGLKSVKNKITHNNTIKNKISSLTR